MCGEQFGDNLVYKTFIISTIVDLYRLVFILWCL